MQIQTLDNVLTHEIKDLYSAEHQITKALPKMAEQATSETLKKGFEKHLEQTKEQIKRLEEVGHELGIQPGGMMCKGMEGLLKEGEELLKEKPSEVLDAALISAAQRVEHYEIAAYGCAITFAKLLKQTKAADLLKKTLNEEEQTDKKLTEIAETEVNEEAKEASV